MADLPILFSAPMVRAILREIEQPGTGKTQTRRVLSNDKPMSLFNGQWADSYVLDPGNQSWRDRELRYAAGDRLYVREAWRTYHAFDAVPPRDLSETVVIAYDADPDDGICQGKFRQGMHMPRWASRLTLTVTDVRVQRLQEISEADAIAEGIHVQRLAEWAAKGEYVGEGNRPILIDAGDPSVVYMTAADADCGWKTAREAYAELWDDLNEARGYGWDANPWVAAYTFGPILGNIDQVRR